MDKGIKERDSWRIVGGSIRQLRKQNGLSLKQLAIGCDLSPNGISLVERGQVAPTIATVCKIAHALGVSASMLFREFCPGEVRFTKAGEGWNDEDFDDYESMMTSRLDGKLSRKNGAGCGLTRTRHAIHCISGSTLCDTEDRTFLITPGDRLDCSDGALHQFWSTGEEICVLVVVIPPHPHLERSNERSER